LGDLGEAQRSIGLTLVGARRGEDYVVFKGTTS
jgi:hypothetical protein